jgi:hypothetical protein
MGSQSKRAETIESTTADCRNPRASVLEDDYVLLQTETTNGCTFEQEGGVPGLELLYE